MSGPPAVIVGIDGSDSATAAALWAVDEAASRDVPVRLVHIVAPSMGGSQITADALDRAGTIVHSAVMAVEKSGKPVKVEAQVSTGSPGDILRREADGAAMLCVGSMGISHGGIGHVGSVAVAVAHSAACPVAIVHAQGATHSDRAWVVAEVSDSQAGDIAMVRGVEEALLRSAELKIVAARRSRYPDIHDHHAVTGMNRMVKSEWERRLAPWREKHPDLQAEVVALAGSALNFFARQQDMIALAIVPHERGVEIADLLGPRKHAISQDICFDILICEPHGLL
ncbi:universal stress protein [Mycolicibacterium iranicum]|uniref:Universal stress protein UspA n=1 Tax=Mycolicibacterium iranicum TaxID=912594 RepID=A0A178LYG0_MYCIR|nr:universal stress protein [Mycolicibacterium iranicum]OAN39859.1 universal stress protein UspA [Mycolicibacterium iranicum]